jgi:hypothetical protein
MQIKSQRDFCSGLMFIVVGVAFAVGASHYSMGSSVDPGAGYFPLILSLLMAILGAIVLFKSLTWLGMLINVVVLSLLAWLICVHVFKLDLAMWPSGLGR